MITPDVINRKGIENKGEREERKMSWREEQPCSGKGETFQLCHRTDDTS